MHVQLKGEVTLTVLCPLTPPFTLAPHLPLPLGAWWNARTPAHAHVPAVLSLSVSSDGKISL